MRSYCARRTEAYFTRITHMSEALEALGEFYEISAARVRNSELCEHRQAHTTTATFTPQTPATRQDGLELGQPCPTRSAAAPASPSVACHPSTVAPHSSHHPDNSAPHATVSRPCDVFAVHRHEHSLAYAHTHTHTYTRAFDVAAQS